MDTFLVQAHGTLSTMALLYSLAMGVWGIFNAIRRMPPDGSYNGALVLAVGLYVVQGLIGVIMLLLGLQPARGLHFLYGVTIMVVIPGIFAFTRGRNTTYESLYYGIGMLFIAGLIERATDTALNP